MLSFIKHIGMKRHGLPNFICVGFGKSGTTSLHYALRDHPDVCLPKMKEAHFFDVDETYAKGLVFYRRNFFSHCSNKKVIGDITPAYVTKPEALKRIRKDLGRGVKIVVILRHPVIRAFSHYIHAVRLFEDIHPFCDTSGNIRDLYRECSGYSKLLSLLFDLFPKENVLPLIFERDIEAHGTNVAYKKVCEFLGIKYDGTGKPDALANTGYLPRVTLLDSPKKTTVQGKEVRFDAGQLVAEHVRKPEGYSVQIIEGISGDALLSYANFGESITRTLDRQTIRRLEDSIFKDDIKAAKKLLSDSIPEWNLDNLNIPYYEMVESRLVDI
ncbi:MAG: hypothetical protein D6694_14235 [Gammaproteobacteria bacterium]|nr:MAG: hypothetical protein D6694_14235 [Gammaproteobacteria bacterium]